MFHPHQGDIGLVRSRGALQTCDRRRQRFDFLNDPVQFRLKFQVTINPGLVPGRGGHPGRHGQNFVQMHDPGRSLGQLGGPSFFDDMVGKKNLAGPDHPGRQNHGDRYGRDDQEFRQARIAGRSLNGQGRWPHG